MKKSCILEENSLIRNLSIDKILVPHNQSTLILPNPSVIIFKAVFVSSIQLPFGCVRHFSCASSETFSPYNGCSSFLCLSQHWHFNHSFIILIVCVNMYRWEQVVVSHLMRVLVTKLRSELNSGKSSKCSWPLNSPIPWHWYFEAT